MPGEPELDEAGRLRLDDWELSEPVQAEVSRRWAKIATETLPDLADLAGFRADFLKIFGFGLAGVDYAAESDPRVVPAVS